MQILNALTTSKLTDLEVHIRGTRQDIKILSETLPASKNMMFCLATVQCCYTVLTSYEEQCLQPKQFRLENKGYCLQLTAIKGNYCTVVSRKITPGQSTLNQLKTINYITFLTLCSALIWSKSTLIFTYIYINTNLFYCWFYFYMGSNVF